MTAMETLKEELRLLQEAQCSCVDDNGGVKVWLRYRYQMLVKEAVDLKKSIDFLEGLVE